MIKLRDREVHTTMPSRNKSFSLNWHPRLMRGNVNVSSPPQFTYFAKAVNVVEYLHAFLLIKSKVLAMNPFYFVALVVDSEQDIFKVPIC